MEQDHGNDMLSFVNKTKKSQQMAQFVKLKKQPFPLECSPNDGRNWAVLRGTEIVVHVQTNLSKMKNLLQNSNNDNSKKTNKQTKLK